MDLASTAKAALNPRHGARLNRLRKKLEKMQIPRRPHRGYGRSE
jgi:hypothetical protein